jgi:D-alanine-D-alanine ligase
MSRRRVLLLLHDELMPPESIEGLSPSEIHPIAQEYDVLSTLQNLGHEVKVLGVTDELAPIRRTIDEWKPDIAFNLLTHFHGVGTYDSYVVSYLELLRCAYTGCNPRGLMLANDKVLSKKILTWHRIPIPRFAVYPMGRRAKAPPRLDFPLFVKSAAEHASVGISQASIVNDEDSLAERVEFIHRTASTDAIAEQYIEGRELTVSVMGNTRAIVFPVWEMRFENLPRGTAPIATSKVKWDLDYQKKIGVKNGPARRLPEGKPEEIVRMARRIYKALGLTGYARIDFRLAPDGRLYVLEANPNPDLCHDEDLADSAKAGGIDYPSLVQRIVNLGLRHAEAWHES